MTAPMPTRPNRARPELQPIKTNHHGLGSPVAIQDRGTQPRPEQQHHQPVWTSYYNVGDFPRSTIKAEPRSPSWSPSARSPRTMPSPMYPSAEAYDVDMRRHERALVERLDQRRLSQVQWADAPGRVLSPIAENDTVVRKMARVDISDPVQPRARILPGPQPGSPPGPPPGPPPPTPASPSPPQSRRGTVVSEGRSILHAVPRSEVTTLGASAARRQSAPSVVGLPPAIRRLSLERPELLAWGHVYLGNATTADAFVHALSLRHPSIPRPTIEDPNIKTEYIPDWSRASRQVKVQAIVRPKALERRPFLMQRIFDLDELRSTIPNPNPALLPPPPPPSMIPPATQETARRRSSSAAVPSPTVALPSRGTAQGHARRRSSGSSQISPLIPGRSPGLGLRLNGRSLARTANVTPLRKFASGNALCPLPSALRPLSHAPPPVRDDQATWLHKPHANTRRF